MLLWALGLGRPLCAGLLHVVKAQVLETFPIFILRPYSSPSDHGRMCYSEHHDDDDDDSYLDKGFGQRLDYILVMAGWPGSDGSGQYRITA